MHIATKLLRSELVLLKPLLTHEALELSRVAQEQAGALAKRRDTVFEPVKFDHFEASLSVPENAKAEGAVLYLHGGGYTAGGLRYAEGFGSLLAEGTGLRTLCAAYRLAPENPYPAALEDACAAYRWLLDQGIPAGQIVLAGESAGGGLCFALCLYLRDNGIPLPGGVVAISPWVDLTLSGRSLTENTDGDPLLTLEQLRFFVDCYARGRDVTDPYISPAFGDLRGLPDAILFAGGDELLRSDAGLMYERLLAAGGKAEFYVAPEMWHAYILYGVEEGREDAERIAAFIAGHSK